MEDQARIIIVVAYLLSYPNHPSIGKIDKHRLLSVVGTGKYHQIFPEVERIFHLYFLAILSSDALGNY